MDELRLGLSCIKKVVERVNELQRIQDNFPAIKDLEARVEDWKGHNITTFGDLILHDTFTVHKGDIGREYNVFLFSKILLCCKELPAVGSKKKPNGLLAKSQKFPALQPKGPLQLKGRIFLNNVTAAMPYTGRPFPSDSYNLQVFWRGDTEQESFIIECRTEEELRTWMSNINRLMDEAATRRQRAYMSQLADAANSAPPSSAPPVLPPAPFTPGGSRPSFSNVGKGPSTVAGQMNFPPAAVADHPGYFALAHSEGRAGPSPMPPTTPGGMLRLDDRLEGLRHDTVSSPTFQSRSTPLGYNSPPSVQPADLRLPDARTRQRSNTEDPRLGHARSGGTPVGAGTPGARSAHVERPGDHRPSHPAARSTEGSVPFPPLRPIVTHPLSGVSAAAPTEEEQSLRLRSASSPQHAYHLPGPMQFPTLAARTVPAPTHHAHHHIRGQSQGHPSRPSRLSNTVPLPAAAPTVSLTGQVVASPPALIPTNRPISIGSTVDSPTSCYARSPGTPVRLDSGSDGSSSAPPPCYVVTVGIRYEHEAEAALTQVVMASIGYDGLLAKVTEKVRVCVGPQAIPHAGLKLKYVDEDGDKIHMQNDEDVSLAFEGAKSTGGKVEIVICS